MEDLTVSKVLNTSLGGFTVGHILSAILTLLVCLVVVRLVMKLVTRLLGRAQKLNERLQKIIRTAVKAVLYLLTAIITAGALGINTTSLTALMSVVTLGVTLAAEDILGNVAGGLVILSSHPFSIGDTIEVDGVEGVVREITLNHTKIEAYDGQTIMQPNKALSSSRVTNYTALGRRRIVHSVSASYDAPTETVKGRLSGGGGRRARRAVRSRAGGAAGQLRQQRHRILRPLLGVGSGLLAGLLRGAGEPAGRLCPPRRGDDL